RPLDLVRVVEAALHPARPSAEAAGLRLETTMPPQPLIVSGDGGRLEQVVGKLLENAIKFTTAGSHAAVRLEADAELGRLTVADTGRGLSADFVPHVFAAFRQADGSLTRTHGGLGIGLAIVRHLVDEHGGRVWATSPGPGAGATFVVELPLVSTSTR